MFRRAPYALPAKLLTEFEGHSICNHEEAAGSESQAEVGTASNRKFRLASSGVP